MNTTPVTSRVIDHVLKGTDGGTYAISGRLPSERDLAEALVVSRTAVTAAYSAKGPNQAHPWKGAFLCAKTTPEEAFSWSGKISRHANLLDEPVLELLARSCAGSVPYPLSAGTPSLDAFPTHEYALSVATVLREAVPSALAVAPAEGQWKLRVALSQWLGLPPKHVMITAGAQEGIDLMARCLMEPGDCGDGFTHISRCSSELHISRGPAPCVGN